MYDRLYAWLDQNPRDTQIALGRDVVQAMADGMKHQTEVIQDMSQTIKGLIGVLRKLGLDETGEEIFTMEEFQDWIATRIAEVDEAGKAEFSDVKEHYKLQGKYDALMQVQGKAGVAENFGEWLANKLGVYRMLVEENPEPIVGDAGDSEKNLATWFGYIEALEETKERFEKVSV